MEPDNFEVYGYGLNAGNLVAVLDGTVGFPVDSYSGKVLISTPSTEVRVMGFRAGQETVYEKTANDQTLYIIEGSGILALGYEDLEVGKNSVAVVPKGVLWGIKNNNSSSLVILQTINKSDKLH